MKDEIVGAKIGSIITNDRKRIVDALQTNAPIEFLTREHMMLMATFDLGTNWAQMASGPTLFLAEIVDDEMKVYPAEEHRN
jgi:hypothetical protein